MEVWTNGRMDGWLDGWMDGDEGDSTSVITVGDEQ